MSGLRTAALGAACSLLVACSTKPAGDRSAASAIDTGSVSAGASAASIDSAAHAPTAATAPPTDTTRPAATPATTAGTGAATTSAAPAAGTGSAGKTTVPAATRPSAATPTTPARGAKVAPTASANVAKPAAAPAASTTAAAGGTTPSARPAAAPSAAPAAQGGSVKVNKFMSYDAAAKTVTLEIIAAYNSVQGGFNFNGGSNGSHTITVPAGWQVTMHVKNVDAIPHSAIVITDQRPLPNAPDAPAIPRAYTSHVNDGLQPQTGADDLSFRASKPGKYLIYCGVPGHGPSGMFIGFVVSESATVPSYQM